MLLSGLLKKFFKDRDRREILRSLILGLKIDSTQKNLFLDSLSILEGEELELLYQKIQSFVQMFENEQIILQWENRIKTQKSNSVQERETKEKERISFNILLDNI